MRKGIVIVKLYQRNSQPMFIILVPGEKINIEGERVYISHKKKLCFRVSENGMLFQKELPFV